MKVYQGIFAVKTRVQNTQKRNSVFGVFAKTDNSQKNRKNLQKRY